MRPHTALIDGDTYVRLACIYNEDENDEKYVIQTLYNIVDSRIRQMLEIVPSITKIHHALGSKDYFRNLIAKEVKYKGTRKEKPKWHSTVKQAYIDRYKPFIKRYYEADDIVTMLSYLFKDEAVICVDDKDLDTVNCYRYVDERKKEGKIQRERQYYYVSQLDAIKNFYSQLLMGDSQDNVIGIEGMGKTRSPRVFVDLRNEHDAFMRVLEVYKKFYKDLTELEVISLIDERANLLYMCRFFGDRWLIPRKTMLYDQDRIAYNSF